LVGLPQVYLGCLGGDARVNEVFVFVRYFLEVPEDNVVKTRVGGILCTVFVEDALAEVCELIICFFQSKEGVGVLFLGECLFDSFCEVECDEKGASEYLLEDLFVVLAHAAKDDVLWCLFDDCESCVEVFEEFFYECCVFCVDGAYFDFIVSFFVKAGECPSDDALRMASECDGDAGCGSCSVCLDEDVRSLFGEFEFCAFLNAPFFNPFARKAHDERFARE